MMRKQTITVKDSDIFLYMLKEDKDVDKNTELKLDCAHYPKRIPADLATKIIESFNADTNYSRINIDLSGAIFDDNLSSVISAVKEGQCKHILTLSLNQINISNSNAKVIIEALTSKSCIKNLTLNLCNCSIHDSIILLFAKALSSGQCPERLCLNFSNPKYDDKNVITDDGARVIISALKSRKCPYGLQINFSGNKIDPELFADINKKIIELNTSDILACVALQQGLYTKQSCVSKLPNVIADKICEYTIPVQQKKNKIIECVKLAAKPKKWTANSFFKKIEKIKKPVEMHHADSKSNGSRRPSYMSCCIVL